MGPVPFVDRCFSVSRVGGQFHNSILSLCVCALPGFFSHGEWKESEDCISPTLPDLAKQLPGIALRDHAPSIRNLQAPVFETARQAQRTPTLRPSSVGQSRNADTLQVSLDPANLKRPHLSIRRLHFPDS